MARVRISKRFTMEVAHALFGHDGACANIHGHSYKLIVTVAGEPANHPGHPKDGMVMDYADLKAIINEQIIKPYDHALILNETQDVGIDSKAFRVVKTPYQPTCENMLLDFVGKVSSRLPSNVQLYSMELWETESNFATWCIGDQ